MSVLITGTRLTAAMATGAATGAGVFALQNDNGKTDAARNFAWANITVAAGAGALLLMKHGKTGRIPHVSTGMG